MIKETKHFENISSVMKVFNYSYIQADDAIYKEEVFLGPPEIKDDEIYTLGENGQYWIESKPMEKDIAIKFHDKKFKKDFMRRLENETEIKWSSGQKPTEFFTDSNILIIDKDMGMVYGPETKCINILDSEEFLNEIKKKYPKEKNKYTKEYLKQQVGKQIEGTTKTNTKLKGILKLRSDDLFQCNTLSVGFWTFYSNELIELKIIEEKELPSREDIIQKALDNGHGKYFTGKIERDDKYYSIEGTLRTNGSGSYRVHDKTLKWDLLFSFKEINSMTLTDFAPSGIWGQRTLKSDNKDFNNKRLELKSLQYTTGSSYEKKMPTMDDLLELYERLERDYKTAAKYFGSHTKQLIGEDKMQMITKEEKLEEAIYKLGCPGINKKNANIHVDTKTSEIIIEKMKDKLSTDRCVISLTDRYDLTTVKAIIADGIVTITVPTKEGVVLGVKVE